MRQVIGADADSIADVLQGELFIEMGIDITFDLSGDDVGPAAYRIAFAFAVSANDQQQFGYQGSR